jgi:hypothetical protein
MILTGESGGCGGMGHKYIFNQNSYINSFTYSKTTVILKEIPIFTGVFAKARRLKWEHVN